jgi:hypothetical protein
MHVFNILCDVWLYRLAVGGTLISVTVIDNTTIQTRTFDVDKIANQFVLRRNVYMLFEERKTYPIFPLET